MDREDLLHDVKMKSNVVWGLYAKAAGIMNEPSLVQLNKDLDGLIDTLQGDIKEIENES